MTGLGVLSLESLFSRSCLGSLLDSSGDRAAAQHGVLTLLGSWVPQVGRFHSQVCMGTGTTRFIQWQCVPRACPGVFSLLSSKAS